MSGAQPTPTVRLPCPLPCRSGQSAPGPTALTTPSPGPRWDVCVTSTSRRPPQRCPSAAPLAVTGRGQGDDPCRAVRKQGLVSPGVDEVASCFWSSHSGIHQEERESLENKADLGEVSPEERDTESSEVGSQVSQGSSDPEDKKIPLQPSVPWSEASNRQFSLRHHLPIRQSTPPSKACQAVCWRWEDREGSDGGPCPPGVLTWGEEYAAHPGRPLGGVVHALD